jgi:DNA-directed RNA polymerase specialized sigma subunit
MTTKEYLSQLWRIDKVIKNKLSEIYQLKSLACSVSVSYDKESVKTSKKYDTISDPVSKIVDLENETTDLVNFYIDKKEHIISQIDSLSDPFFYHVLSMRYIGNKTFEDISSDLAYSKRQVLRLHDKAISDFEKKYGCEYLSQ